MLQATSRDNVLLYRVPVGTGENTADPITTEVVRHALNSAANQAKLALIRTAFSPIIYEVLDFAIAIYDRDIRMLAQSPGLPIFMGSLNFCVEEAVRGVGGVEALEPGDVLLYNVPYGSGTHPQDASLVMPAFLGDELVGYSALKAHWLDIGAKEPYCTDTVDVFQEGTMFPGVKIASRGKIVSDIFRTVLANSRVPEMNAGDIQAEMGALNVGATRLVETVERFGSEVFHGAIERMYNHGEAVVRDYLRRLPDGRYVGHGVMDNDGVNDVEIPFEIGLEIDGGTVRLDFSGVPDQHPGPMNCLFPTTVSATRVALATLAGASEAPNEGHFRPIEIFTRPGSMFHPVSPAPCYMPTWPGAQAMEVIFHAVAQALPSAVPACSGGDASVIMWWGNREATGEPWADGHVTGIGQGGHAQGDGANAVHHHVAATSRLTSLEVWEAKNPWLFEQCELAVDSCGAGEHRGGLGLDLYFHMLEDAELTSPAERTKNAPWGLEGGAPGRPQFRVLRHADGTRQPFAKVTRLAAPKGSTVELHTGGGGGFGNPADRPLEKVIADVADGYITEAYARENYPQYGAATQAASADRPDA